MKYRIRQATSKGYIECCEDGLADLSYPDSKTRRGRVQGGGKVSPTITATQSEIYKMGKRYRIRKLTPRECFRLMGVKDGNIDRIFFGTESEWVNRAASFEQFVASGLKHRTLTRDQWKQYSRFCRMRVQSNTQCYKQAGNSIVVPVLMALFSQMNIDGVKPWNDMSEDEIYKVIEEHK